MSEQTHHSEDQPEAAQLTGEYDPVTTEQRWQDYWVAAGTYEYEPGMDPDTTYAIDTPPPTVSGNLHMGHLYGHTLQDFAARFHRMDRETTFFPFGYDDNGIASERLTERELGINHGEYARREFQQKTREVSREYESAFTEQMQALGCSIDWSRTYKTIEPRVQRLSQLSFLDLYEQGREYRQRAPTIWCPDCQTAISQVELEDAQRDSHEQDIAFELVELGADPPTDPDVDRELAADRTYPTPTKPGDEVVITTTRPELIPACVAMFVHPDDERNAHLVGGTARVPLFGHEVPIYEDERVDADAGTGIVMSCTFGDQTDIEWYQAHDLALRTAIDESATMTDLAGAYAGMDTHEAREAIVDDLDDAGRLRYREAISHAVQVHERCETDVEYRVTEQWYVELLDRTDTYLEAGREMDWYPEKMFSRYEHWIEGLEWDWCISRQRDSGVPFPVWYCAACGDDILADREDLPVEPIADEPPVDQCPSCGADEFEPETDVFDTWATSSLTPLINAGWDWYPDEQAVPEGHTLVGESEDGVFALARGELYPFDLRPQGHDIISFWLFHTVVKCFEHTGEVPFESVLINGFVLDENREKMSKSRGNVIEPTTVMAEYPVDAIRYWAASASLGDDFPFRTNELAQGEKLLQKLWNASKLVDQLAPPDPDEPAELKPTDRWILAELDGVIGDLTDQFRNHEYLKARNRLREFFWNTFCDDYLEIAKQRASEDDTASTAYALTTAHRTILKLFAPLLPHITEEIWAARYGETEDAASIHLTDWPTQRGYEADTEAGQTAMAVVSALRRYKTDTGLALNEPLAAVEIYGRVEGFESAIADVMHIEELLVREDDPAIESNVTGIDLEYATVGPKYGNRVQEIEAAIDAGEFELVEDGLAVAGEVLAPEVFTVREERSYDGAGDLIETDEAVVIVHTTN